MASDGTARKHQLEINPDRQITGGVEGLASKVGNRAAKRATQESQGPSAKISQEVIFAFASRMKCSGGAPYF